VRWAPPTARSRAVLSRPALPKSSPKARMACAAFGRTFLAAAIAIVVSGQSCEEGDSQERLTEPDASLNLLQKRARSIVAAAAASAPAARDTCSLGDHVTCPGTPGKQCGGDQCCPGTPESGHKSFPCPSAGKAFSGCDRDEKVLDCLEPCLCTFDIDRTLTGQQSDLKDCPADEELPVIDTAYGGGNLTLSVVGQGFARTFCAGCYVGVVTAGDASGWDSDERQVLIDRLRMSGKLVSTNWTGPSLHQEGRRSCEGIEVDSPLVVGCIDGTKQFAVEGIRAWLKTSEGVDIPEERVWHFDDRANNVAPFRSTKMNARQVSCKTRAGPIGLCGAVEDEIVDEPGVKLCHGDGGGR